MRTSRHRSCSLNWMRISAGQTNRTSVHREPRSRCADVKFRKTNGRTLHTLRPPVIPWHSGHCRGRLKCDGTRAETRFHLSAERTSPFKSAGASVQSTAGSRGVRISGSNAGYTMFRGSVKGTGYPLHSPVSPSLPLSASPCAITFQMDSTVQLGCVYSISGAIYDRPHNQFQEYIRILYHVDCVLNVMAHEQKPEFVFRRNGRVHLYRRGRQFSRLLAAEVCASAVVMIDTPCSEVVWRVLATHSIRQFPLHFPSRASQCAITFQLESNMYWCKHWKRQSSSGQKAYSLTTNSTVCCCSLRYIIQIYNPTDINSLLYYSII